MNMLFISFIITTTCCIVVYILLRKHFLKNQTHITNNTVILITGGCNGIGYEILYNLITQYHCTVINIDILKEKFTALKQMFRDNVINIYCDLSQCDIDFVSLLKSHNVSISNIDIVINNAGVAYNRPFAVANRSQINKTIHVNLLSHMLLTKAIINEKVNSNSNVHIVTIASVMSHLVSQNSCEYVASKWGLFAFHESLRAEYLYQKGFDFTIVCPFAINTGMFEGFRSPFPFLFKEYDVKWFGKDVIKRIALKDKVIYYPWYARYFGGIYKILPTCIMDIFQYIFCKLYIYI
jgi:all-trans-retinol dehydrogenase (NAD+)